MRERLIEWFLLERVEGETVVSIYEPMRKKQVGWYLKNGWTLIK